MHALRRKKDRLVVNGETYNPRWDLELEAHALEELLDEWDPAVTSTSFGDL
jgi:hypothetical protein